MTLIEMEGKLKGSSRDDRKVTVEMWNNEGDIQRRAQDDERNGEGRKSQRCRTTKIGQ